MAEGNPYKLPYCKQYLQHFLEFSRHFQSGETNAQITEKLEEIWPHVVVAQKYAVESLRFDLAVQFLRLDSKAAPEWVEVFERSVHLSWLTETIEAFQDRNCPPETMGLIESRIGGHFLNSDLEEAEMHFGIALTVFRLARAQSLLSEPLRGLGIICLERGKLEKALEYFEYAAGFATDSREQVIALDLLARVHFAKGDLRAATKSLVIGYMKMHEDGNFPKCVQIGLRLAEYYEKIANKETADGDFESAKKSHAACKQVSEAAFSFFQAGQIDIFESDLITSMAYRLQTLMPDQFLSFTQTTIDLAEDASNAFLLAKLWQIRGLFFVTAGKLDEALDAFEKSKIIATDTQNEALLGSLDTITRLVRRLRSGTSKRGDELQSLFRGIQDESQ